MTKLSVIIPCYNVSRYVENCVESIIKNNVKDMEIILVDDGSTDNTLRVINKIEKKYSKIIKVISQQNQGLSMARNAGLDIASGEYVAFVDSDDTIDENMFNLLLKKAEEKNYDIVVCGVKMVYSDHELNVSPGFDTDCNNKDDIKKVMSTIYPAVWNKIYKRSAIGNLRFKMGVWYEDVHFIYRLLPLVNSIGVVDGYYYNYYQRKGSITYTYNHKLYDLLGNLNDLITYYKNNSYYNDYYEELEYCCVRYSYATFIKRLAKTKDKKIFDEGVLYVMKFINDNFPNYRNNKYLKKSIKGLYLKYFNRLIGDIVYITQKNKKIRW